MTPAMNIGALVSDAFSGAPGAFRPCAMFDEPLDCIRVVAKDCSVTETRVNHLITVLEDNYSVSPSRKYVGFTIKGARHFCESHGFSVDAPIKLTDILDAILKASPEVAVRLAVDAIARPLVEDERIERVDLSHASVVPQTA